MDFLIYKTMILNTIIIEHDPDDMDIIRHFVETTPTLNLVGAFSNVIEASQNIHDNNVDLVFLCIKMQELNGVDFAKILPPKIRVVFTTAFKEYALDGFRVNAVDYMLKPIQQSDFQKCCRKVFASYASPAGNDRIKADGYFITKSQHVYMKVKLENIVYIECSKEYVLFHMNDNHIVKTLINMKHLEEELPQRKFLRIHRSYIVNMDYMVTISKQDILLEGDHRPIPISETYRHKVLSFIESHLI